LTKAKEVSEKVYLSIIIPAYNEEENIAFTLSKIAEYLKGKEFSYDITVVDDGSGDATVRKALEFKDKLNNFQVIESKPNRGKGFVLKKSMLQAAGEYIMFMDADSSVSIGELDKFLLQLKDGSDIYIASRRISGAEVIMPWQREIAGKVFILLSKFILGLPVNDINCGFKLFRRDAARDVFSRQVMNDWSYDAEILFLSKKYGYKVKEIPVKWVYKATSKVRPLRDAISSFISLMKIRNNEINKKYE
jgi:dolichyl-phosphate beta-glucosyltransferase